MIYQLGKSEGDLAAQVVGALLNMAVFAAVIAYVMQCLSFIMLRKRMPNIERPYGASGASGVPRSRGSSPPWR